MTSRDDHADDIIRRWHAEQRRSLRAEDVFWKLNFTPQINHFRVRLDTVTLDSVSWTYGEDVAPTNVALDTNIRLRIGIQETGGAANTTNYAHPTLLYSRNGGAHTQVTDTSSFVRYALSSQFANNATMNGQLSGSGTLLTLYTRGFEAPSTTFVASGSFTASDRIEVEHCITFRSADGAAAGDVYTFFEANDTIPIVTPTITIVSSAAFTPAQTAYRFAEDGTDSGATLIGSLNTALSRNVEADSNLLLFVRIQETGGAAGATTDDYQLQYTKNGGLFGNVTDVSSNVHTNASSALTEEADHATGNFRLGAGSGTASTGEQDEVGGLISNRQIVASGYTEHVWALTLVASALVNADALTFRVLVNGAVMTYTVTPTINVVKTLFRQQAFRFGSEDGTESTHGWLAELNTNINKTDDATTFLIRFLIQAANGGTGTNTAVQFEYNKNGAGWNPITTTSANIKAVATTVFNEADTTTSRLSGTGTFESTNAGCSEDGTAGGTAMDIVADGNAETVCAVQLVPADVVATDTIQLRITTTPTAIDNYVQTPTITVTAAAGATSLLFPARSPAMSALLVQ